MTPSTVEAFLDDLASAAPTPGGGSAAAVMGAMGAALISMVCNVTMGKKGQESAAAEMQAVRLESETLRVRLTGMVDDDIAAFDGLMAAYRLPKISDEDKSRRIVAIQVSLRAATETPLACARACAEVILLSKRAAAGGYTGVISDAGVGVLAANAALRSAALNIYINVPALLDRDYAKACLSELESLLETGARESEVVVSLVRSKLP